MAHKEVLRHPLRQLRQVRVTLVYISCRKVHRIKIRGSASLTCKHRHRQENRFASFSSDPAYDEYLDFSHCVALVRASCCSAVGQSRES